MLDERMKKAEAGMKEVEEWVRAMIERLENLCRRADQAGREPEDEGFLLKSLDKAAEEMAATNRELMWIADELRALDVEVEVEERLRARIEPDIKNTQLHEMRTMIGEGVEVERRLRARIEKLEARLASMWEKGEEGRGV